MKIIQNQMCDVSLTRFGLKALLFVLPWQTVFILSESFYLGQKSPFETIVIFGFEILFWCVFFCFCFEKKQEAKKIMNPKIWIFFILVLFAFDFHALVIQKIIHLLEMFGFFLMIRSEGREIKNLLFSFLAGAIIPSVFGIMQFLSQNVPGNLFFGIAPHALFETGTSVVQNGGEFRLLRAYGTFSHPNVFGGFLVISLFVSGLWYILRVPTLSFLRKILFFLFVCIQSSALFFTFSRSAWLSVALVSLVFFFEKNTRKISYVIMVIFFAGLFLWQDAFQTRLVQNSYHESVSKNERVLFAGQGFSLLKSYPFFGVGPGAYTVKARDFFPNFRVEPPHNIPILFSAEWGIVGILFFCFVLSKQIQKSSFWFALFLLSPIILFDHYLYTLPIGMFLFIFSISMVHEFFPLFIHRKQGENVSSLHRG